AGTVSAAAPALAPALTPALTEDRSVPLPVLEVAKEVERLWWGAVAEEIADDDQRALERVGALLVLIGEQRGKLGFAGVMLEGGAELVAQLRRRSLALAALLEAL